MKVKTFTSSLEIFHTKQQLDQLDELVNKFVTENDVESIVSVSDTCTADDSGKTVGIIRVIAYED